MTDNPYDALGLPTDATQDEIKRTYRKQAMDNHPDRGGDPDRFALIAKAYEIIGDPSKREHFDKTGQEKEMNSIEHDAAVTLCGMFQGIVDAAGVDVFWLDVVAEIRDLLKDQIRQRKGVAPKARKKIKHYEKILGKLKRKENTVPFLENAINQCITGENVTVLTTTREIDGLNKALEMLKAYTWDKATHVETLDRGLVPDSLAGFWKP